MGCYFCDSAGRGCKSVPPRYREPNRDHNSTVAADRADAATRLATRPALDRAEARKARSRLATRASRIQRACDGKSEAAAPSPAVRLARRTLCRDYRRPRDSRPRAGRDLEQNRRRIPGNGEIRPRHRRRTSRHRGLWRYPEDAPPCRERIVILDAAHTPALTPLLCKRYTLPTLLGARFRGIARAESTSNACFKARPARPTISNLVSCEPGVTISRRAIATISIRSDSASKAR